MVDHQDWTIVKLGKKPTIDEKKKKLENKTKQITDRIAKLEDNNENFVHKFIDKTTINKIILARTNLKLNRKQLAIKCNLREQDIADIETGKVLASDNKIRKVLKVLKI